MSQITFYRDITPQVVAERRNLINHVSEKDYDITIKKLNQLKVDSDYLEKLQKRQSMIKQEINKFWQMQTPERVNEQPSPPYIIMIKDEEITNQQYQQSELQPPLSTYKSLCMRSSAQQVT